MPIAITRQVSPSLGSCQLTFLDRAEINASLAHHQHLAYQQVLAELGYDVLCLDAEPQLPDAVFVEDTAIVLDEVAIITRPGAETRRPETASISSTLLAYRPLVAIQRPATLEGGDVLRIGKILYVGISSRSNNEGIAQLRRLASPFGYRVEAVEIRGCLHLKSAATLASPDLLLVNPEWVDPTCFKGLPHLPVDPHEPHAANALLLHNQLIYPGSFPNTQERLSQQNISMKIVDVSELQKAEGAVTCCSLIVN